MAGDALKRSAVMHAAALCETDWSDNEALSLDDAISLLESGRVTGDMKVDFGDGTAQTVAAGSGMLQRLKGHRMLLAVVDGAAGMPAPRGPDRKVWIDPEAEALLDALPDK